MIQLRRALPLSVALLSAEATLSLTARAQAADTLRGRVTTDSGVPIPGAEVVVTRAPDRAFKSTITDKEGRYQIIFEQGTGDYLLHVAALGRATVRVRVKRTGNENLLSQDVQLKSSVQQLETVTVSAQKEKPERSDTRFGNEPGESGKRSDGVNGAVPPDAKGNLAAIASTLPGVSLTPSGISVLGLDPSQNRTTLNGMAFSGADIPRAARTNVRVSSSSYDPARGWFNGAEIKTNLEPGFLFTETNVAFTVDAPALQYADRISRGAGQKFTNIIASLGNSGPFATDRFNYSFALEGAHRSSPIASLEGASADVLEHSGLSRDSADRLLTLLSTAGIQARLSPSIARASDYLSFIGRIDRADRNPTTFETEKQTWGLLGYAKFDRSSALGIGVTAPAMHGGESFQKIVSAQGSYSRYFHDDNYLTEARTAINVKTDRAAPYIRTPAGTVLVTSDFPDALQAIIPVSFGGNSSLDQHAREWTWETNSDTRFYASTRTHHRVELTADSRIDGVDQSSPGNSTGTFSYNSLADLAANTPSVFTRTLNAPSSSVREWNGFAAIGDYWRKSRTFQLLYGARLEGNRFLDKPANNPGVATAFGVRNDHTPASVHISPRVGFTWIRVLSGEGITYNGLGTFHIGSPSYVRGGFGEFRSMLQPGLLSRAMAATGLPGGAAYLTCIGPAVPTPDWAGYELDPTTIPTQCADGSGIPAPFSDASPNVVLFDRTYQPPRSWRGNLAYASTFHSLVYSIEGIFSLNLNQPGRTDLNFKGIPQFRTDEGRSVYVGVSSIDQTTGVASTVEARKTSSFGPVILNRSDLRSVSRQATLIVYPPPEYARRWFGSIAYTLSSVRALASGFDAPTFDSPLQREWSRADLDTRHHFVIQGGLLAPKEIGVTLFGHIRSGLPFTPVVGSDVNGDGLANDRAFIFQPSSPTEPALGADIAALAARSSNRVRDCLTSQYGRATRRNSCEGPWTATLNMQLTKNFEIPNLKGRYATVALAIANPLGGLDQLLHGTSHLHGWGSQTVPDSRLYTVRGFDSAARRFNYEVNQRFGNTQPANRVVRAPFRLELDISLSVGPPLSLQQLERWIGAGRNRPGPKLTVDELKSRYRRNVPDPYADILEERDSLLLSAEQEKAIQVAQADYKKGVDSLWTSLAEYLFGLGNSFDSKEALRRQEETVDAVWEYSRLDVQRTLKPILSPVQLKLLPWPASMLYYAAKPVHVRIFMYGPG